MLSRYLPDDSMLFPYLATEATNNRATFSYILDSVMTAMRSELGVVHLEIVAAEIFHGWWPITSYSPTHLRTE